MRIVSLLASGTEITCALGAGDALVGRSHECDNPEWVRRLPACTRPAFDITRPSREIDTEVRRRIKTGEPLYHVDAEMISALKPDILITQVHCEVCAVTPGDLARAGCSTPAPEVIALTAGTVAGIYDGIRHVAHALRLDAAGERLIADMQRRIDAVTASVSHRPPSSGVLLEWTDPVFTAGNWAPELIEAAGGTPVLGQNGAHSTAIPWERVVEANPDYIVVAPCGFDLERSRREAAGLERLPNWFQLAAVRNGRVAFADGNKYFNRSGTTIVETVEILAEILHGGDVPPRWRGEAWTS